MSWLERLYWRWRCWRGTHLWESRWRSITKYHPIKIGSIECLKCGQVWTPPRLEEKRS